MRFDNPIMDHGFEFPDIAQYSDVKSEWRFDEEADISNLYKFIEQNDWNSFEAFLGELFTRSIEDIGKLDIENEEDMKIFDQINVTRGEISHGQIWMERLKHFFSFYQTFEKNSQQIDSAPFSDLYTQGVHVGKVNVDRLKIKLEQDIQRLLDVADWRPPPGTFDRAAQLGPNIISEVQALYEQNGFIEAASAYNQRQMKIANVVLHIAKPTDQNYKQFLYDCQSVPKTTCMHIDPKEDVIKSMIYLEDVDKDTGPFSYIPGSNRWVHDPLQNLLGRAISTGSYCDDPIKRKGIFRLPSKLRVSHNFGRILEDGSEMSDALLGAEWKIEGETGTAILFDPGAGIHRGGICNTGTRVALQVLMK
jgi:hypothetical protein